MKVYFLGPEGSYSHIITKKILNKEKYELVSCNSFLEVVNNTLFNKQSLGILPIENSITSDIHENIDFLFKNDFYILHEGFLKINLHLIGLQQATIVDIKNIYSHMRALAQCTEFIKKYNLIPYQIESTSAAKETILQLHKKENAGIGSNESVTDGKLKIIEHNIENDHFNMTRFVFISLEQHFSLSPLKNKTTIIFTLPHAPGSLAQLLTYIAKRNFNLTKIESRPIPGTSWEYQFWIDIESIHGDFQIEELEKIMKKNTISYKIVGVYQKGKVYES